MPKIAIKTLFLTVLLTFFTHFAFCQQQDKYLVEDVLVNFSANSPENARNGAVAKARRDAFLILLTRLELDLNIVNSLKNEEIDKLVRFEQIFDEKISGNNYGANFKIYFAKDFVDDLLIKRNLIKPLQIEQEKLSFLIIPVKNLDDKNLIFEDENNFKNSIQESLKNRKIAHFKLIEADIENLSVINSQNISKIEAKELQYLFEKYNVDVVYIAFFSYQKDIAKASVLIRGFEKMRKFQYRLGFINSNNLQDKNLVFRVADKMTEYLSNIKDSDISRQNFEKDVVQIEIPILGLGNWLTIKNRIENSGFASKLTIDSVSRDYVVATILCENSLDIEAEFAKIGFQIKQKAQNIYIIKSQ